jgi:hypothetical protein
MDLFVEMPMQPVPLDTIWHDMYDS